MKKVLKVLVILFLMIPFVIRANTYETEKQNVNGYILRNAFRDTYNRYIIEKEGIEMQNVICAVRNCGYCSVNGFCLNRLVVIN